MTNRVQHLQPAREYYHTAMELYSRQQLAIAGEILWGAVVHAVSAADYEHDQQPSSGRNAHPAPYNERNFQDAVHRIYDPSIRAWTGTNEHDIAHPYTSKMQLIGIVRISPPQSDYPFLLENAQKILHNNFYQLNETPEDLRETFNAVKPVVKHLINFASAQYTPA